MDCTEVPRNYLQMILHIDTKHHAIEAAHIAPTRADFVFANEEGYYAFKADNRALLESCVPTTGLTVDFQMTLSINEATPEHPKAHAAAKAAR